MLNIRFRITFCFILFLSYLSVSSLCAESVLDSDNAFIPPWGKTILIVGQDKPTIDEYVRTIDVVPAGVMVYTSIQELSGLVSHFSNGAGVHHAQYLMEKYPDSTLQLGLYMVGALLQINQGVYDGHIDKLADWIKEQERPVFLRIGYEFDNADNNYDSTQYIYAFQRIVKRIRAKGVTNVAFVWHSDAQLRDDDPMRWYPGDEYVDWFAASYFSPTQYETVMALNWAAYAKVKPFMIAEASPFGAFSLRAKKDWYKQFFKMIDDLKPAAVCYINTYWDQLPAYKALHYGDARVQQVPEIKEMWLNEIQKDKYIHAQHLKKNDPEISP